MEFSEKERAIFVQRCAGIRNRLELVEMLPEAYRLFPGKNLHIWKRFRQLQAMSDAELMAETEADDVILGDCLNGLYHMSEEEYLAMPSFEERMQVIFERRCERIANRLAEVVEHTELARLTPGEDLYVWKRLEYLSTLSEQDLRDAIEADDVLLFASF